MIVVPRRGPRLSILHLSPEPRARERRSVDEQECEDPLSPTLSGVRAADFVMASQRSHFGKLKPFPGAPVDLDAVALARR